MNSFTIRDIENLCGIKAHTLRICKEIVLSGCLARELKNLPASVRPLRSIEEMHAFAGER